MYKIITIEDRIRVPPEKLGLNVGESVKKALQEKIEGTLDPKIGVLLSVVSIDKIGEGRIMPEDPGVYYQTVFKTLIYKPELHELVYGKVVDNTEFGAFIRIGAIDGLAHISQLMDDFVSFDAKNSQFLGRETKKILKEGDDIRARIISISWGEQNKIGLTMRQSLLGNIAWIEEEKRKKKKGEAK
jgi:DNA-directed RNA polymerase subunit E'